MQETSPDTAEAELPTECFTTFFSNAKPTHCGPCVRGFNHESAHRDEHGREWYVQSVVKKKVK